MNINRALLLGVYLYFFSLAPALAGNGTDLKLPDLCIKSLAFDPEPCVGRPLGTIKLTVSNQGTADAPENKLDFDCLAFDCGDNNACLQVSRALKGSMVVPLIKQGSEAELKWAPKTSLQWVNANFMISAIIDPENKVQELHEANNSNQAVVYLKQFAPEIK